MKRLTGEYDCKIDAKGRMRIPAALVEQLGGKENLKFTINRGYKRHLMIYPEKVWEKKTIEIDQLNNDISDEREAIRYFYRGATEVKADSAERILIPKRLAEWANIDLDVVLFAYQDKIECWSKDAYEQSLDSEPENYADIMDRIHQSRLTKP
ncbi:MAG TPA: division/cell wall cluster transcriptional repressor MraZ [Saprospiraceae bacterium]|nr:division/cell wall cluster transcriptional repressor MraZ [Saprospiraceae bacterium]MCB9329119.1 division/cell wall cluster transcriptional repressor MraZ [Lewinellaceae bacterium]HPK10030.1 division/cell wall cluster transcriptional repressor MraZ [Saprospiraceae bacterium]HPQ20925.1 division/cell wall cluster transcriptional repressor MraZ [Saprospiraceae bacterium]HRX29424.1 division/cell wall cluster transcriptional repressor MraZ [Saprospiraceae bacterium]